MFSFSGQVVWVTGSSTGIGRAVVLGFAEQGCNVVAHYNHSEEQAGEVAEQVKNMGQEALLVQGDVADAQDVKRMVGEIEERFGRLDVLINNAGSLVERASLEEMSEKLWDRVMDVNLKSVFLCSQAVLSMMKRQGGGRIINVSSVAARNGGRPGFCGLRYSKGRGWQPYQVYGQGTSLRRDIGERSCPRCNLYPLPRPLYLG